MSRLLFRQKQRSSMGKRIRIFHEWVKWEENSLLVTAIAVIGLVPLLAIIIASSGKISYDSFISLTSTVVLTCLAFGICAIFGFRWNRVNNFYFLLTLMVLIWILGLYQGHGIVNLIPLATFLIVWLYNGQRFARRMEKLR